LSELLALVKENIVILTNITFVLQLLGTVCLSLFSLYGIEISDNKEAIIEGIQTVKIAPLWLRIAQLSLITLIVGIMLSWIISLVSLR